MIFTTENTERKSKLPYDMQKVAPQEALFSQLQALHQDMAPDVIRQLRSAAWERFVELGLPTRRSEGFQNAPLHKLYYGTYQHASAAPEDVHAHVLPECVGAYLVFVNGCFRGDLSDFLAVQEEGQGRVVVGALADSFRTYGAFLANQWNRQLLEEKDPFAVVNAALHKDGCFVYLPPKTVLKTPLQIIHWIDSSISTENNALLCMPRLQVFVGRESALSVVMTTVQHTDGRCWVNAVTDFTVEEGSAVNFLQDATGVQSDGWHNNGVRALVKRDSAFKGIAITDGAQVVRNKYDVLLAGEGSEGDLKGIALLQQQREAHAHVRMEHQAPHCRSRQLFKNVLKEESRSGFDGTIAIQQCAQKSDAFQLNNNLVLSNRAHADSKPNLEIFADDVKASHGATIGKLDEDELFYLKSRGFSNVEAKQLLISGFCREVLDDMTVPSVQKRATQMAARYYHA